MDNELIQTVEPTEIRVMRDPSVVLAEAKKAAQALMEVVKLKPNPVKFNGQQYLEYEDWQTVAKFYGITAKVTRTNFIDFGGVKGFEAAADAVRSDGIVISSAEAMCLNDEDNWSTRTKYGWNDATKKKEKIGDVAVPLFQLKSMAQTRACAKALRNVLAWVVVLAGFQPTPADEMTGDEHNGKQKPTKPQPTQEALDPAGFKTIKSKFDGTCKSCNGPVKAGDEVLYNPKLKGVYHPACLNPKETPTDAKAPEVTKKVLENLEKMASASGKKLIDRIGVDGLERLDQITPAYAQELLAEYAALLDERQAK